MTALLVIIVALNFQTDTLPGIGVFKFINYIAFNYSYVIMKLLLTERNIAVVLFVMVLITFSLAQNETKKMEQLYNGGHSSIKIPASKLEAKTNLQIVNNLSSSAE